jgi:hypothetical protein
MIKAKFGDAVRNKTDIAMVNEQNHLSQHLLCDQEMHEFGIGAKFWSNVRQA